MYSMEIAKVHDSTNKFSHDETILDQNSNEEFGCDTGDYRALRYATEF